MTLLVFDILFNNRKNRFNVMNTRRKIAAFRPDNVLKRSKQKSDRHGFDFFGFPVFELVERKEALPEITGVFEAGVDIVVFTSYNGVKNSFSICEGGFNLKEQLKGVAVYAIGPATRRELVRCGVQVDFMPEDYSAKGLMALLDAQGELEAKRIAFLRSAEGGNEILAFLREKGASVTDISVYEVQIIDSEEEKKLYVELVKYKPDYVIFTSAMTFKTFLELAERFGLHESVLALLANADIAAIGDLTAESIRKEGMKVDIVAGKSTFTEVLNLLKEHASEREKD